MVVKRGYSSFLKHMEVVCGDYSEYMKHADEDVIKSIQACCDMFSRGKYKTTKSGRKSELQFLKPIEKRI